MMLKRAKQIEAKMNSTTLHITYEIRRPTGCRTIAFKTVRARVHKNHLDPEGFLLQKFLPDLDVTIGGDEFRALDAYPEQYQSAHELNGDFEVFMQELQNYR
jgi:hypothetical protein